MTTYFDDLTRAIINIPRNIAGASFIQAVEDIESPAIQTILLNTGDREFPDDLREEILGLIATKSLAAPSGLEPSVTTKSYVQALRHSRVLPELHRCFHTLAARGIVARFGPWTDDPADNLKRRDAHDQG